MSQAEDQGRARRNQDLREEEIRAEIAASMIAALLKLDADIQQIVDEEGLSEDED